MECHNCHHKWDYKGNSKVYATCPVCHYKVRVVPRILVAALLVALLFIPVFADDFGSPTEEPIEETPVEKVTITLAKDIEYRPVAVEKSFLEQVMEVLGLDDAEPAINAPVEVYANEKKLAVIPSNSRLMNIPIHDYCLNTFGYGTDSFIVCEATI